MLLKIKLFLENFMYSFYIFESHLPPQPLFPLLPPCSSPPNINLATVLSLSLLLFCLWVTEFIQGFLYGHGDGSIHWSKYYLRASTLLKAKTPPSNYEWPTVFWAGGRNPWTYPIFIAEHWLVQSCMSSVLVIPVALSSLLHWPCHA